MIHHVKVNSFPTFANQFRNKKMDCFELLLRSLFLAFDADKVQQRTDKKGVSGKEVKERSERKGDERGRRARKIL